jgi:hypothetical protein
MKSKRYCKTNCARCLCNPPTGERVQTVFNFVCQRLFASQTGRAFRCTTSGMNGRKISQRLCIYHAFSFWSTCMARSHSSLWYARECYKRRDVNGSDRIGLDFVFTISFTICFRRIRSGADNDRMQIRKRIYLIADSKQKWSGFRAEIKLIGSVRLKVVNNHTTKNTNNKNGNIIKWINITWIIICTHDLR